MFVMRLAGCKHLSYFLAPPQAAVETQRKYKHVLWYSLFVAAYLIVLYLQASAYNSGEVVSTLRNQLMPGKPPPLCCICVHSFAAPVWSLRARPWGLEEPRWVVHCVGKSYLWCSGLSTGPQHCRPLPMLQRGTFWPQ